MIESGAKKNPVLSAVVGDNSDLFADVIRIYAEDGDIIVDPTYGKGVFWKEIDTSRFVTHFSDLSTDKIFLQDLPYDDNTADIVVLDPPYMYRTSGSVKESIASCYGINELEDKFKTNKGIIEHFYKEGLIEARRVVKDEGYIFVKCQDIIESSIQRWNHIEIFKFATENLNLYGKDLFVMVQTQKPAMRWDHQYHARKNHSYLWIFEK